MDPHSALPPTLESRLQDGLQWAMKAGADGAEAFVHISESRKARFQNHALDELIQSKRGGLGLRILKGGRTGLVSTTDLESPDLLSFFRTALELAELGDPDPWNRQAEPSGVDDLPPRFRPEIEALSSQERIERARILEESAWKSSAKVSAVRGATWSDGSACSLLLTQKGIRNWDLGSWVSCSIELAVREGADQQSAWEWDLSRDMDQFNLEELGHRAVQKGLEKLHPQKISSGRTSVLLHPDICLDLFGIVADMLQADSVLKQRSLFAHRLGQQVASPLLSLVDDGRLPFGVGSQPWDGEGLPTRRNVYLERGVLKSYLHNLKTSAQMDQEPTANASRSTGSNPGVSSFNLQPLPGETSQEELYRMASKGILLTEIMGLHTVNPISGDFSVGASGRLIEGGELTKAVDQLTLAGNILDLLQGIVAVGSDLYWRGSSGTLSLLIEGLTIGS